MRVVARIVLAAAGATMLAAGWRAGGNLGETDAGAFALASHGSAPVTGSRSSPGPSAGGTVAGDAGIAGSAPGDGTYAGPAISTRYGVDQVSITVADGVVTDVQALALGQNDATSRRISSSAFPALVERVLQSQSANVSYVSGASYTSAGVLGSVEGALQDAGLA